MLFAQLRSLALVTLLAGCHGYSLAPQNLRRSATRPAAASRLCVVAMADDLSKLTVKQLKEKLKDAGLPVSGKKAELIERLGAGGTAPPAAAPAAPPAAPAAPPPAPPPPAPPAVSDAEIAEMRKQAAATAAAAAASQAADADAAAARAAAKSEQEAAAAAAAESAAAAKAEEEAAAAAAAAEEAAAAEDPPDGFTWGGTF